MAIIDNKVPQPPPPPPAAAPAGRRVVVKLTPPPAGMAPAAAGAGDVMQNLLGGVDGASWRPYFTPAPAAGAGAAAGAAPEPAFGSYMVVDLPPGADPLTVARNLTGQAEVEIAYVEGGPTPPPLSPSQNPFFGQQGYLAAAPQGIDAIWTWTSADGSGVNFVDLERGWTLNHEDLAGAAITVISGINTDYPGHGTAVLGEVLGVDNTLGVIGIAPGVRASVVSQWRTASDYQTADAIRSAMSVMREGDILLLEAQTTYAPVEGYLPVEVEQAVFDAIRAASDAGIIVIEAGANGNVDLDQFQDMNGRHVLNRASPDFRDSGAIMVGAAASATPHARLSFSNFGSRIDCFAWGEHIRTTGDGWTGNSTNTYTPDFGGTSGASPIVTGAAILLQSWARRQGRLFTPRDLRALMSDPALNTASATAADRIGVMPDLKAILTKEMARNAVAAAQALANQGS